MGKVTVKEIKNVTKEGASQLAKVSKRNLWWNPNKVVTTKTKK